MIFQNFGFNRLKVTGGAPAPPAALFPDQSIQVWTATETAQWLSAASTVFTVGNGTTYGTPSSIGSIASNTFSGVLAKNGKIYMAGDGGTTIYVWNTNTNAMTTITTPAGLVSYVAVYNDYSKCAYFSGNGVFYVINTLTDTYVTSISNPLGSAYALLYSSGYDARYIYGNGWFLNNSWFKIDCNGNTATVISGQSSGGDTLQGPMAKNGKIYMGGGGGSGGGFHVWDANTNTNQFVSAMGNISDQYRGAANHYDGYTYTLPAYGASNIWQINPSTNGASVVLGSVPDYHATNHIMGADGLIYAFGNLGTAVVYNPVANSYSTKSVPNENLQWSVIDKDGNIYFGQNALYKMPASSVPAPTLAGLAEMNGNIARMR